MPFGLVAALNALTILPLLAAGNPRVVGWRIMGAFLVILGVAAALPEWTTLAGAPGTFVAVSAGFFYAGLAIVLIADRFLTKEEWGKRIFSNGDAAGSLKRLAEVSIWTALIFAARPLIQAARWRGAVAGAGLLGSGVLIFALLGLLRAGKGWRWLDDRWLARHHAPGLPLEGRERTIVTGLTLIGLAVALGSGHLLFAIGGALTVVICAHRLARAGGFAPALPIQPILAAISLLLFAWFVATIAGPDIPLRFPGILDAPLSETAEAMLALILGLGAWVLLGLWPFHGTGPGSALALLGGALLLRWGMGLLPFGLLHAAPIFALVAALSALHAAATGRVGEYTAALGVLAVTTGHWMTWAFFALASLVALMRMFKLSSPIPGLDRRELGGVLLIPVLAAVLPAALRGETVLTVVAVLAGVALFLPSGQPS